MFLIVDKPIKITSFWVIKFLKKFYIWQKIWHSWTLDPNATGLMILGVWDDTKNLTQLIWLDKTYTATIDFSKMSDTRDIDYYDSLLKFDISEKWLVWDEKTFQFAKKNRTSSKINFSWFSFKFFLHKFFNTTYTVKIPDMQDLKSKLDRLVPFCKLPLPSFSAKKVKWKRLYKLARKWKVTKEQRKMKINSYKILEYNFPLLKVHFDVWSGTYIRSIAYWLWQQLEMWWILTELRRESTWKYKLSDYKMKSIENSHITYCEMDNTL